MKKILILFQSMIVTITCWGQFNSSVSNLERTGYPKEVQYLNKSQLLYVFDEVTLISSDGGRNFGILDKGLANSSQFIKDSIIVNATSYLIRKTNDLGMNWTNKYLIQNNGDTQLFGLYDLSIFNNGYGFVTGYKKGFKPKIFVTKNFGESWAEADSLKNNFSEVKTSTLINNYKLYKFDSLAYKMRKDSDSLFVKYFNFGDSVVEIDLKKLGIKDLIRSYAFKNKDTGLFITKSFTSNEQHFYLTTDGCNSFTEVNTPNGRFVQIDYAKSTKQKKGFFIGTFIGSNNLGGTAYSYDYGQTWVTNIDPTYLYDINFYDAETGIASNVQNLTAKIFYFTELTNSIKKQSNLAPIGIFPNPATNTLNLNISEDFRYSITNLQGQVMQREAIKNASNSLDISKLPIGVYIINLTTETGNYYTKFIKTE